MSTAITQSRWTHLLNRWPTAVAIALTLLTLDGEVTASAVEGYGEVLLLLAWPYVIGAQLEKRRAAWPLLAVGMTLIVALRIVNVVPVWIVLISAGGVLLAWGVASGRLRTSGTLRLQSLGLVGLAALSLMSLTVGPDVGVYLVAAGWFLHGIWDFVHLWLDRVVVRSYAEWCGVLDVLIAAELVFLA